MLNILQFILKITEIQNFYFKQNKIIKTEIFYINIKKIK